MKTEQLITLLSTNAGAVESGAITRQIGGAVGIGALGALALLLAVYGANPELHSYLSRPAFWVKIVFAASLFASGIAVMARLAQPGAPVGMSKWLVAAPVIVMWLLAIVALADADPAFRSQLVWGSSWRVCPFNIALLSLPAFIASLWALKQLAPTRLRLAGGASGLVAGALGALVYGLHCSEFATPFLGVWYVIGVLIPTLVGIAIGPKVLRW